MTSGREGRQAIGDDERHVLVQLREPLVPTQGPDWPEALTGSREGVGGDESVPDGGLVVGRTPAGPILDLQSIQHGRCRPRHPSP